MASKPKKSSKKKRAPKANAPDRVAALSSLHKRISNLETHFKAGSRLALLAGVAPSSGGVVLTFSLQPGAPSIVRLTLDGVETLVLGSSPVSSSPKQSGSLVSVLIELWGTQGQQAVIAVNNGMPSAFSSTIPPGRSDWSEPRTLKVS